MNHTEFWKKYAQLEDKEAKEFLKTYMFSLPTDEMKSWVLSETRTIVNELKQDFSDPSVKSEWKQKVKSDLANVVSSIENNNSKAAAKKAA